MEAERPATIRQMRPVRTHIQHGELLIATVQSENLSEMSVLLKLKEELAGYIVSSPCIHVILDMHMVRLISTQTLSTLISIRNMVEANGGSLTLCALNKHLHEVMQLTRLDRVINVAHTLRDATTIFVAEDQLFKSNP